MMTNEMSTAMGKMRMATSALRKCSRNAMQTSATTMLSSIELLFQRLDRPVDQARVRS